MPLETTIQRGVVLSHLKKLAQDYKNGKYFVRRGAIDWPTFNWPKPYAIAIRAPENGPYTEQTGGRSSQITLTMATRIPTGEDIEVLDQELDDMEEDALKLMEVLSRTRHERGKLVISVDFGGSLEFYDARYHVQGFNVLFVLEY